MINFLHRLLEPKPNGPETAITLAKLLGVKITNTTLRTEIEEHPAYPSLLSISDILNKHGIENIGLRVDKKRFFEIPVPFISQIKGIKSSHSFFTVVDKVSDGFTSFFDPEMRQWGSLRNDEFLARASGVALIAEAGGSAGEKDYLSKRRAEKRKMLFKHIIAYCLPVIIMLAGVNVFLQHGFAALLPLVFLATTLAGALTGTLLLWYEVDQHNFLLNQICSMGKKTSCGSILQSKAAKVAGISWSAIGFSYFAGLLLLLLFWGATNPVALAVVSWLTTLAIIYVPFSLYYQWRVAKQWCVLCLLVQGILLLQFIVVLIGNWHSLPFANGISISALLQFSVAFAIPFIVVAITTPALLKSGDAERTNVQLMRLKHNPQMFKALLQKQKELSISSTGLGITLGNSTAAYKLIKVCNPYCGPCARAHKPIEDLLEDRPDVQVQILFTASTNPGDIRTAPVQHLLAISQFGDEVAIKKALDDWYLAEEKNYNHFSGKYPLKEALEAQSGKVDAMQKWCSDVQIKFTPTFFVSLPDEESGNSDRFFQLPEIYTVNDLKYFLDK